MNAFAAVGLGEVMLRLSPSSGRRIENADAFSVHVAGAEANVLAALARLGASSALITALPDSPPGRRAANELLSAGVDLGHVRWVDDARMGTFYVEQGVGARCTSVVYDRARSAFAEHVEWPAGALREARVAVLSGITPALSEPARRAAMMMVEEASELGVPLCLDVNYRARLWPPETAREVLAPLLARAAIIVCSVRDAEVVFDADPEDPSAFRRRWGPAASVCVITRGEHGALAVDADGPTVAANAFGTTVVDRLGLGDAFVAGLIDALLQGQPLADALQRGAGLAALKATVLGDLSLARPEDLDALLAAGAPFGVVR